MGCCASNEAISSYNPKLHGPNNSFEQSPQHTKAPSSGSHHLYSGELGRASVLFSEEKYAAAAGIYRKYLQSFLPSSKSETVEDIDGLGQTQLSLGYYEWFLYRWYKEGIEKGDFIGTVYDALSLCYQALKGDEAEMAAGMKWYQDMVDQYPENHALTMGYANMLNNKGIFEQAIDYYNRVLDLKPKWIRPLQCMAYIYQYKRVQKKKSVQLANKLLEFDPKSRVALFVIARNQTTPEEKIAKLKIVVQLHPKYARAINEIGIVYGGTLKQYREAITWYQKASEVTPEYASCYNNIGVNYELLKEFEEAIIWYFRGIERDKEYKAPHANLSDIFDDQKFTDDQISAHMLKYKIQYDYFYYYMGLAYYDKKKYDESIKYYMKSYGCAKKLAVDIHKIHNSAGITYDDMRLDDKALEYYKKAIEADPKYHSAYYNMAIVYKRQNKLEEAINWYKKAIEVNPRYSYAYNNLGNIYKTQMNYDEAIKCYKKAVQHLSTYTLAYANMGVCYLKVQNFRQAFNAMERAKECLPTDNNNLSASNKAFLKENLDNFDKEGESWRQNGSLTTEQRNKLKNLITNFQKNFSKIYSGEAKEPISLQKVLKKQILEIVRLVHDDQFELKSIDKVYDLVKDIFEDNEEYFHIVPELFIQYFYKNTFIKQRPILEIESELFEITKRLSAKTVAGIKTDKAADLKSRHMTLKMKHFDPPNDSKVNLFKLKYFNNYEQVYGQIMHANDAAGKSYQQFKNVVDYVKKQSYGTIYGIGMKIPRDESQQYKVILRIFQKMFKKQLTKQRVQSIIAKIDIALKGKITPEQIRQGKRIGIGEVIHDVMEVWTKEITDIVKDRKDKQIETKCEVSDLLRAKVMFDSLDHLKKAIAAVDQVCNIKSYKVIQMDNRLAKQQTQDVVFKIQIKEAICEFQLAMKQDEAQYHFTHSIYEIERSPLGCIFGSYIFMSKGFQYPFFQNCKDIRDHMKLSKNSEDRKTYEAAQYIVKTLEEK